MFPCDSASGPCKMEKELFWVVWFSCRKANGLSWIGEKRPFWDYLQECPVVSQVCQTCASAVSSVTYIFFILSRNLYCGVFCCFLANYLNTFSNVILTITFPTTHAHTQTKPHKHTHMERAVTILCCQSMNRWWCLEQRLCNRMCCYLEILSPGFGLTCPMRENGGEGPRSDPHGCLPHWQLMKGVEIWTDHV